MKKVLIIGCGSIGIRHIRSLINIGGFDIAVYRTKKGNIIELPDDIEKNSTLFYDIDDAYNWKPEFVILSNPTSLHLDSLIKASEHDVDILVEKPIAVNHAEIVKIKEKFSEKENRIVVGYNLRFHPIVDAIKEVISSKKYGNVLTANLYVGHYLPYWHPYEDYTTSYAARRNLGGGVLRTLSHEIDLGQYWFGNYSEIFSKILKISNLNIDVDDYSFIFAKMKNGVYLNITMDYLNPISERYGTILFEKGLLQYNFENMEINFVEYCKNCMPESIIKLTDYSFDLQYRNQLIHFLSKNKSKLCSFEEGINVLKIIDKCEESSQKGMIVNV